MRYLPVTTTVRRLSQVMKKAGLIPPSFDKKSEAQFLTVATGLGFHVNEAKDQISEEKTTMTAHPKQTRLVNRKLVDEVRKNPCAITEFWGDNFDPIVVHHLITVGSFGPDLPWNLLPMRRSLHTPVIHVIGIAAMAKKYLKFKSWLLANGWTEDEQGQWSHSREEG